MKIIVYTKSNNRYIFQGKTLEHARERCKRIIDEGLLLENFEKEEFYPPEQIYKVQITFTDLEIEERKKKYKGLFPNYE